MIGCAVISGWLGEGGEPASVRRWIAGDGVQGSTWGNASVSFVAAVAIPL